MMAAPILWTTSVKVIQDCWYTGCTCGMSGVGNANFRPGVSHVVCYADILKFYSGYYLTGPN
jgi:hypothetical protein